MYHADMRVLSVGTTSVLGRYVAEAFRARGCEVAVAGRGSPLPLNLGSGELPDWVHDQSFDLVINFAGIAASHGLQQSRDMVLVNSYGPLMVAGVAEAVGASHMVHISTWYAQKPHDYRGSLHYPLTKRLGDQLLQSATSSFPFTVSILRPTHVYDDDGQCRPNQPALYWMVDEALAGRTPDLPEPNLRRDYLHVEDLDQAVQVAAASRLEGIFTVTSPQPRTFAQIAKAARNSLTEGTAEVTPHARDGQRPQGDPLPGFQAAIPIELGIQRVVKAAQ